MSANLAMLEPAILVPSALLDDIQKRADKSYPREAGGFLLGVFKGEAIEVIRLTGPFSADKATRTRFIRRDPRHKAIAVAEWLKSGKVCTLVGDWHSHPDGGFTPSSIDTNTWKKMSKVQSRNMVGIIRGRDGVGVYWYDIDQKLVRRTRLIQKDDKTTIWEPI